MDSQFTAEPGTILHRLYRSPMAGCAPARVRLRMTVGSSGHQVDEHAGATGVLTVPGRPEAVTIPITRPTSRPSICGTPLRVLLVDDHIKLRTGLRALLEGFGGIAVVGEAGNGEEAVLLAQALRPALILMDVHLPHVSGYEATRRICALAPTPAIIGLSVGYVRDVEEGMLAAGAVAYLRKEHAAELLHGMIDVLFPHHMQAHPA
jgi:CheY-like chemotaxis protein